MSVTPAPAAVGRRQLQAASLPRKKPRQVFVAYAYGLYPKADYRKVYNNLKDAFNVNFIFADEKITTLSVLEKITGYITESQFGIYDISGWNPNVTLELGLAFGLQEKSYLLLDPTKNVTPEAPSDLRGLDRLQYGSFAELEEKISFLLAQELPVERSHDTENQIDELRQEVFNVVSEDNGLRIGDLGTALGISTALAQVVVKPLVGEGLRTEGVRKGTKYFLDPGTLRS